MLEFITEAITFIGLVSSLWLGLYVLSRSPRRLISWLTALTLWSVSGLFFNILFALDPPPAPENLPAWLIFLLPFWRPEAIQGNALSWLQGWSITLAIAFWHHVTVLMRSGPMSNIRRVRISIGYILAIVAIFIQKNTDLMFKPAEGNPLFISALQAGPYYLFFSIALLIYLFMSFYNLMRTARETPFTMPRQQLYILSAATVVATIAGPVAIVSTFLGIPIPMFINGLLLTISVILIGYGIARYSALMEDRTLRREFLYHTVAISLVTFIYLVAALVLANFLHLSWSIFIVFIMLAIITHTLVDLTRSALDSFFYKEDIRSLRARLRSFSHITAEETSLSDILSQSLDAVCNLVRASKGLIVLFNNDKPHLVAAYKWPQPPQQFTQIASELKIDDISPIELNSLPPPFETITLIIPLYDQAQQIGALLLSSPINGIQYAPTDIESLLYPTDQIAETIHLHQLRAQRLDQVSNLLPNSPSHRAVAPEKVTIKQVENAMRSLYDFSFLGDHPIASFKAAQKHIDQHPATHVDKGQAVHRFISQAIEKLRPPGDMPGDLPPREWYPYLILHNAYIEDIQNRDIMSRLYISEGTFNRTRRAALRAITRVLNELEAAV